MKTDGNTFRQKRFGLFLQLVDTIADLRRPTRVLDIGGTASYWEALKPQWKPRWLDITIVNHEAPRPVIGYTVMKGDARGLPFQPMSFDVVHSNSVIEHVGKWSDMMAMSREVHRLAPHYFVQLPFVHWLSDPMRARVLAWRYNKTRPEADAMVRYTNMLDERQMQTLFPGAKILKERCFGFTKSLMAVK